MDALVALKQNVQNTQYLDKLHAPVARSTFSSQNVKTDGSRESFGSSDVEKLHNAVARSTFSSHNAKNMKSSGHFWREELEKRK